MTLNVAPPCGARGLKYDALRHAEAHGCRAPMRGAWIEIARTHKAIHDAYVAPPCGARGLKFLVACIRMRDVSRAPMRGAWIEIP